MSNHVLTILAGGYSRRFQAEGSEWLDKALLKIRNKPLLINIINQGKEMYDDINISVNSRSRKREYERIIQKYIPDINLSFTIDLEGISSDGVLKGMYSTLTRFSNSYVQFIPSDRPYLDLSILKALKVSKKGVSILQYSNGMIEPLLALYGEGITFPKNFSHFQLSRADVPIRISNIIQAYSINDILEKNELSPKVFTNINVQEDIDDNESEGSVPTSIRIPESVVIRREALDYTLNEKLKDKRTKLIENLINIENYYLAFLHSLYFWQHKEITAQEFKTFGIESLKQEHEFWITNKMPFLALHALDDLTRHFPEEKSSNVISELDKLRKKMKIKPRRLN